MTETEVVDTKDVTVPLKPRQFEIIENPTPEQLIQMGIMQGVDLDQLIKLRDKLEEERAKKDYYKAMTEFKKEIITVGKDGNVDYVSKKTGIRTKYDHTTLANAVMTSTPILSEYGLTASWKPESFENKIKVTLVITHENGHSEESSLATGADTSGGKNAIQAMGSTISYLERYLYMAMLGLASEEQDDDGIKHRNGNNSQDLQKDETITIEQVKVLQSLLLKLDKGVLGELLKTKKCQKLSDIPTHEFKAVKSILEQRIKARKQKATKTKDEIEKENQEFAMFQEQYEGATENIIRKGRTMSGLKAEGEMPDDPKVLARVVGQINKLIEKGE